MARLGRSGERRGLSLLTVCLMASALMLVTGRPLLDLGADEATAQPAEVHEGGGQGDQDAHPELHEGGQQDQHEAGAHTGGGGHHDPVAPILIWLVLILVFAKLGGDLFDRIGQPAVLGELVAGVIIGNLLFFLGNDFISVLREGTTIFDAADKIAMGMDPRAALSASFPGDAEAATRFLRLHEAGQLFHLVDVAKVIDILARIAVVILLFLVGLESDFKEMLEVGVTSLLVAVVGIIAPFGLGYLVGFWMLPDSSVYVHLFIGATLCATSVGITARVFKDLNKLQTKEAKIILGAAVIDDILGLIILAVVQGIILAADLPAGAESPSLLLEILKILGLSILFLGGALFAGRRYTPLLTSIVSKMRVPGMKVVYSLAFAFLLSWLADLIGLAAIVGAFAAGLVLDDVHFKDFRGEPHRMEERVEPIATILVPVFFVLMGLQVKLETFADVSILGLAAGITIASVIGKQVCGLAVRDKSISRVSIGIGMIPRGEVGLIFAAIGKTLTYQGQPVIDSGTFSAVVIMVILTTLLTPPLLKVSLANVEEDAGLQVSDHNH